MVNRRTYVPEVGDIVWLQFDPQAGHEQAGHRPALVLSPAIYNSKAQLMVCCPLSTKVKNHPFEVQRWHSACELCGSKESFLDEVIMDDQGKKMFVCSDSDYCSKRQVTP